MTLVGKAKLDHPALGTAGGSGLHAAVESIFENVSNHLPSRWKLYESIANGTTTTFEHNLQVPFADLRVHIYTKGVSSNTKVADLAAAGWSVVATTSFLQTKLDVTAPSSGGPFDFYLYVSHEPMADKLDLSGGTMTGTLVLSGDPSQATHAATKNYVDSVAQGLDVKASVKCTTTANITLSGTQTIDGVAVSAGHRVLVKNQTTASQNGIYEVAVGAWSRASDMDFWTEVPGAFCFVEQGTVGADTGWVCTADQSGTIGTTAIAWSQFAGVGNYTADGQGIELSGTQFALELDGNSLSKSASGVKVNPSGDLASATVTAPVINASGYQDFSAVATPASPSAGKLRAYAKTDGKLYTLSPAGIEQAVGSGGSIVLINKTGHGFVAADVGCPVYFDGTDYIKAMADTAVKAEVIGLINRRIDADNFELCLGGEVSSVGANAGTLVAGTVYFLSGATAGLLTAIEPTVIGQVSKPLGVARTSTALDFINHRGQIVGSANARTQINLANTATTTVQDVSLYDAGSLEGWVYIDATTDLRFYVRAPFSKYGAGGNYYISPVFVGDTPPAGFSITVTAAGLIQATLPSVSGYVSAVINFALNAPAVGTNFPLSVDGTQITGGLIPAANLPLVSSSAKGAFPSLTSSLDDATATQLGLKQYLHGTTYSGGIAPTVASGQAGFSVVRAAFIPYQTQDGTWRVKFNIAASITSASLSSIIVTVNGIVFKSTTTFWQSICGYQNTAGNAVASATFVGAGSNQIVANFVTATVTYTNATGDVELNAKPTWAY